jgi:hypothetical protein
LRRWGGWGELNELNDQAVVPCTPLFSVLLRWDYTLMPTVAGPNCSTCGVGTVEMVFLKILYLGVCADILNCFPRTGELLCISDCTSTPRCEVFKAAIEVSATCSFGISLCTTEKWTNNPLALFNLSVVQSALSGRLTLNRNRRHATALARTVQ